MLPLLAIGGVIGAVFSITKGAGWLADQLTPRNEAAASADKSAPTAEGAQSAQFAAALAAQTAGQTTPPGMGNLALPATPTVPSPAAPGALVHLTHGTDYDTLARLKAGIAAYGSVGERHDTATPVDNNGERKTPSLYLDSVGKAATASGV